MADGFFARVFGTSMGNAATMQPNYYVQQNHGYVDPSQANSGAGAHFWGDLLDPANNGGQPLFGKGEKTAGVFRALSNVYRSNGDTANYYGQQQVQQDVDARGVMVGADANAYATRVQGAADIDVTRGYNAASVEYYDALNQSNQRNIVGTAHAEAAGREILSASDNRIRSDNATADAAIGTGNSPSFNSYSPYAGQTPNQWSSTQYQGAGQQQGGVQQQGGAQQQSYAPANDKVPSNVVVYANGSRRAYPTDDPNWQMDVNIERAKVALDGGPIITRSGKVGAGLDPTLGEQQLENLYGKAAANRARADLADDDGLPASKPPAKSAAPSPHRTPSPAPSPSPEAEPEASERPVRTSSVAPAEAAATVAAKAPAVEAEPYKPEYMTLNPKEGQKLFDHDTAAELAAIRKTVMEGGSKPFPSAIPSEPEVQMAAKPASAAVVEHAHVEPENEPLEVAAAVSKPRLSFSGMKGGQVLMALSSRSRVDDSPVKMEAHETTVASSPKVETSAPTAESPSFLKDAAAAASVPSLASAASTVSSDLAPAMSVPQVSSPDAGVGIPS